MKTAPLPSTVAECRALVDNWLASADGVRSGTPSGDAALRTIREGVQRVEEHALGLEGKYAVRCNECHALVGITTDQITATSMTVCLPCQGLEA